MTTSTEIPLVAIAAQTLNVNLSGQPCKINLYQKTNGLYADVSVLNQPIVTAMLCRDRVGLVRHAYLGFIGSLAFVDTQGKSTPYYTGLGARFRLVYTV